MSELEQRASDDDRERVTHLLRDAAGDGRLTLEELSGRLDRTFAARTRGELDALTHDLAHALRSMTPPAPTRRKVSAIMSGAEIRGRLRLEGWLDVRVVMGGVSIDLTQAELANETTIDLHVTMGGVEIIVPPGVHVESHELAAIIGGHSVDVPEAPPGAPVIHLRGRIVMGGCEVRLPRLPKSAPRTLEPSPPEGRP
jgi:hypothetical protein